MALFQQRMTCSDDGVFHIHKAVGLEALLQLGYYFPRWSPQMAHGFGYPLYNFYAPLASYVMVGWHAMGLIYPLALHITLGLSILLSGLAMYALVREWWGEAPAVGAAVLYLSAPYLAFDTLFRGALAETMAWVFPPLLLLALDRALRYGSIRWGALAALAFGALLYTHNTTALVIAPLAAGFVLVLGGELRSGRAVAFGAVILFAGLALGARFWLPALAETQLVQTERLLVPPIFTYYTNFITPTDLLAQPTATNTALINPSPAKALGLVTALVAAIGLVSAAWRTENRVQKLYFGIALIGYGFMTLEPSLPLWDMLPLMRFVQFPWRLLMPATLCAAILTGAAIDFVVRPVRSGAFTMIAARRSWLAVALFALGITLANLSWWYPRYCSPFEDANVASMLDYEYATDTLGTSAKAEFLPISVLRLPEDDSLTEALQAGDEPTRLSNEPAGTQTTITNSDPLDFRAELDLPTDGTLVYKQFRYKGWYASVDGAELPTRATVETGLIEFDVPAGRHAIRIWFGTTPLRTLANTISLLAVLGIGVAFISRRGFRYLASEQLPFSNLQSVFLQFLILATPVTLVLGRLYLIDRSDNLLHRTSFGAEDTGTPLQLQMENGLVVLGYEVRPNVVSSGATFDALLYLTPLDHIEAIYLPKFELVDSDGRIWNVSPDEALPPRWHRTPPDTQYWPVGEYAQFARHQIVAAGTPPGDYELFGVLFDLETLQTVRVLNESGIPAARRFSLGMVSVERPETPPALAMLDRQFSLQATLGGDLTLVGYNVDRQTAAPGEQMLLTFFIRAEAAAPAGALLQLRLGDTDLELEFAPTPNYPTAEWQRGDIWRSQLLVRLPASTPGGEHLWTLRSFAAPTEAVPLTTLVVEEPARVFTPAPIGNSSDLNFDGTINLAGFSLTSETLTAGDSLSVKLVWHPLDEVAADLIVFVHAIASDGTLIAQSDAAPAGWTRPTPGWLPGEYITDNHSLLFPADISPGEYEIYIGLAAAETGRRSVPAGSGALPDGRALLSSIRVNNP